MKGGTCIDAGGFWHDEQEDGYKGADGTKCGVMQAGTKSASGSCGWEETVQRHFVAAEPRPVVLLRAAIMQHNADHQLIRGCAMLIDLADNPTPPAPPCVPCTLERRPAALF